MLKFRESLHGSINYPLLLQSLVLAAFILLASSAIYAQKVSISALIGYQMGGNSAQTDIVDDWNYGFLLSFPVWKDVQHDVVFRGVVNYSRQNSALKLETQTGSQLIDMSVEYFHVGALIEKRYGNLVPFGLFSIGSTKFKEQKGGLTLKSLDLDEQRFSIAFGLGTNIFVSKRVGFRFQGRVLLPTSLSDTLGEDGQPSGKVEFLQFDLSAGVTFQL